jgi:hypothetical protein
MDVNKGKIYKITLTKTTGETALESSYAYILETVNYITLNKVTETEYSLYVGNTTTTKFTVSINVTDNQGNNIGKVLNFNIVS